jgi:hypothetical protein
LEALARLAELAAAAAVELEALAGLAELEAAAVEWEAAVGVWR